MSEQKIVNIKDYSDNIILTDNKEVLDTKTLKKNEDTVSLFENKIIEGDSMNEFITKDAFNQFEKRMESNITNIETNISQNIDSLKSSIEKDIGHLDDKIKDLPTQIETTLKNLILEQNIDYQKERKEDRKSIITWSLGGTSVIIAAFGLIAKLLNWI